MVGNKCHEQSLAESTRGYDQSFHSLFGVGGVPAVGRLPPTPEIMVITSGQLRLHCLQRLKLFGIRRGFPTDVDPLLGTLLVVDLQIVKLFQLDRREAILRGIP